MNARPQLPATGDLLVGAGPLPPLSPLSTLDRAFSLLRGCPLEHVLQALLAGAPFALCVISVYALERVEGVTQYRLPCALLLTAAFVYRALALSRVSRAYTLALRPGLPVPPGAGAGHGIAVACTAAVVGFELWSWAWPLAALAQLSPALIGAFLPVLALRGAVAPSWLSRAACAPERGMAAFGRAVDDTAGVRGVMFVVELLLLLGAAGLFVNLYAASGLLLLLSSSLFGVEVAFVSAFLSPDNDLVLLLLAVLTLLLLEPLRAAISAQAFTDARGRRDGADLHAEIDALAATARQAPGAPRVASRSAPLALALLLLGGAQAASPRAARAEAEEPAVPAVQAQRNDDDAVREKLSRILTRSEFREPDRAEGRSFWEWLHEWVEDALQPPRNPGSSSEGLRLPLPSVPAWLVMLAAALLLLVVILRAGLGVERASTAATAGVPVHGPTQAEREPGVLLDEAARLAQAGKVREALRALYVATLVALHRSQRIHLAPDKTNGQYLRSLPRGELREAFAAFTGVFERTWYGCEVATMQDYQRARQLAERICSAHEAK